MPSPMMTATLQAAVLNLCSCLLATIISHQTPPVIPLLIFTLIATPPNYLWQQYIERAFPGYSTRKLDLDSGEKEDTEVTKLNVGNTFIKFGLDQTFGAAVNTVGFLVGIRLLRGFPLEDCWQAVKEVSHPER
jgi:protein Mpv17